MKIVYLDQNKWIQLARVWHGKDKDPEIVSLLSTLGALVDQRRVCLPLSATHLIETSRRGAPDSRRRLAVVMWTLSLGRTVAGYPEVARHEIRVALRRHFPSIPPRPFEILGTGWHHAFGHPAPSLSAPSEILARQASINADDARAVLADLVDGMLLAGTEPTGENASPYREDRWAKNFQAHLRQLRPTLSEHLTEDRWDDALRALSLADILEPINEILAEGAVAWSDFMALGQDGLSAFLHDIPTRRVDIHLHRQVLRNAQLEPRLSDMNDWSALIPAIMYSDIVVCEKHFANLVLRDGFTPRAELLTDIRGLNPALVA